MTALFPRRQVLGSTLAGVSAATIAPAARAATLPGGRLLAGTRVLDVQGRAATVFSLRQPSGVHGITLAPGEPFRVELENHLAEQTIIHWHGQLPPWTQDGFPWPETPPLAPGAKASYNYAPIPGTFWMHSHHGMQEQQLMTAPLIVRTAAEMREDRQEIVLMLHDFSFRSPAEILAGLMRPAPAATGKMAAKAMDMSSAVAGTGGMKGSMGAMKPDLNDVHYDAFLANDRTLADPEIVAVERAGRVRLRVINGSSASAFWLDLGALQARLVAVDGHGVQPLAISRLPLAIAQRVDLLIDLPQAGAFPILAQLEGSRSRTGVVLAMPGAPILRIAEHAGMAAPPVDNSLEIRLATTEPLKPRQEVQRARIVLDGHMQPYHWTLNSETWPDVTPLMLKPGARVEIDLVNKSMMAHPMHLHGHAFQIRAINGKAFAGAVRDTVLVEPRGSVRIAFDADNPGRWPFHCHNLYHMMTGMMTEFRYEGITL